MSAPHDEEDALGIDHLWDAAPPPVPEVAWELDPAARAPLESQIEDLQAQLRRARTWGAQTDLRRRIARLRAELAGGVVERAVVAWLRKRATESLGALDAETFLGALPYLPGWSAEPRLVAVRVQGVPGVSEGHVSYGFPSTGTKKERETQVHLISLPRSEGDEFLRGLTFVGPRGPDPEHLRPDAVYVTRAEWLADAPPAAYAAAREHLREELARWPIHADAEARALREIRVGVTHDGIPIRLSGWIEDRVKHPHVLAVWPSIWMVSEGLEVTAPSGAQKSLPEAVVAGKASATGFWRWAYDEGLDRDAARAIPEAERRVPPKRAVVPKPYRTCGACWQPHANMGRVLAHHGYNFPGHLYRTGGACFGSGMPPWEVSPASAEGALRTLEARAAQTLRALEDLRSGKTDLLFRATTVQGLDALADVVSRERVVDFREPARGEQVPLTQRQRMDGLSEILCTRPEQARHARFAVVYAVGPTHPEWRVTYERAWARSWSALRAYWSDAFGSIPWYRAAIRRWQPALERTGPPRVDPADILDDERFGGAFPPEVAPPSPHDFRVWVSATQTAPVSAGVDRLSTDAIHVALKRSASESS